MFAPLISARAFLASGDCRDAIKQLPDNLFDSVVTDPPYALVSITKRFGAENAAPAQHGRDGLYARASAGFMGKMWDTGETAFAAEFWREVFRVLKPGGHMGVFGGTRTYHRLACAIEDAGFEIRDQLAWVYGSGFPKSHSLETESGEWTGWGTALKPAWEPICLARKPTSEKTNLANMVRWRVGGLNIDSCRVDLNGDYKSKANGRPSLTGLGDNYVSAAANQPDTIGRWPANLLHDGSEEVTVLFPQSRSGALLTSHRVTESPNRAMTGKNYANRVTRDFAGSEGSAARFFYCAKAGARDRRGSKHPTVKPIALLRWLCRLITPPGGLVLDPFAGSGTTGEAAMNENFRIIMAERESEYQADITNRFKVLGSAK